MCNNISRGEYIFHIGLYRGEYWHGKKISLILDHKNGDKYDNRLENLQIVCPNCNSTLETHCRGNRKLKGVYDLCSCGCKKRIKSNKCKGCVRVKKTSNNVVSIIENDNKNINNKSYLINRKENRTVERPSYDILLEEINELGYVGTGKKYGVSDNAIRKWVKMYEKHGKDF